MIRRCEQFLIRLQSVPDWLWLTGILLFSLGLKLLCWYLIPTVSRDGSLYLRMIQVWYDSGSFQGVLKEFPGMWIPPLPIYLMKCLMSLGLSAENAGVLLNLATGTFTPLLAYGIAREVTQKKGIALCSALLIAVNKTMNDYSHEIQRDMVYLFFIGIVLWFLAAGIRRQKRWCWLCAGLICGCAMLTRFETLEFCVIVPVALVFLCMSGYCSWKKGICCFVIFSLSFLGSILSLSSLMRTQDYLLPNYKQYYQNKLNTTKRQFDFQTGRRAK